MILIFLMESAKKYCSHKSHLSAKFLIFYYSKRKYIYPCKPRLFRFWSVLSSISVYFIFRDIHLFPQIHSVNTVAPFFVVSISGKKNNTIFSCAINLQRLTRCFLGSFYKSDKRDTKRKLAMKSLLTMNL